MGVRALSVVVGCYGNATLEISWKTEVSCPVNVRCCKKLKCVYQTYSDKELLHSYSKLCH